MLEAATPAFLASFLTWLTPTVLFLLLNVVIGTIAVTSKASRRQDPVSPAATNHTDGAKLSRSPSAVLHREPDPAAEGIAAGESGETDRHLRRSQPAEEIGTKRASGRSEKADRIAGEEGEEVDARADDFINRFRQQLKLQRLGSAAGYEASLG